MRTTVLSYLEESAERYGDKVAFFDDKNEITFGALRRRAVDLGWAIRDALTGRRQPVLVYLPKSVESIVALMGILYSGNCYTPTDTRFPPEKVASVIAALKPAAVIVNNETKKRFQALEAGVGVPLFNLDEIQPSGRQGEVSRLLDPILDVDPVYVFFTSGSTGAPKGVVITNRNVIDYTDWAARIFKINENTVMGNQSPLYFDISTQDIYTALKTGASVGIIPPVYFAFPAKVLKFIQEHAINHLYWVPSAFVNIANFGLLESFTLDSVKLIMFGGEVMPVKQLNQWRAHLPSLEMVANVYGPTEATVNCTYYIQNREFSDDETLPLGKACENTGIVLLDEDGNAIGPDRPGISGQMCVYGSSLSPGYWDDPDKTAEKFIQNPLCPHYGERIYLTGDLASYNERGELVFIGRMDSQIKHLGYRIELGEIESMALGHPGVREACAAYDSERKEIVLFCQGDAEEAELRVYLGERLPKYSVPSAYRALGSFPHNDNGKVDRRALMRDYLENRD